MDKEHPEENQSNFNQEDMFYNLSVRQFISSRFPKSVQNFVYALKKNRSCQRFIREKLMEIEAKIEVNKKLKERMKCLMDFHTACKRKAGYSFCQKRDPRVRLISSRKQKSSSTVKENSKKSSALYFAPAENFQMSNYKMVTRRFPVSLRKRQWSNTEKDRLLNGVKQQCLEVLFLNSMNLGSDFDGLNDSIITSTFDIAHHQLTPEILRSFIHLVNWDRLASMYLPKRSGPSCESSWLNHGDPIINCNPWTSMEDKKLLFIVQDRGLYDWIGIALTLGTNRTPFQCLARYQRSLNPHILNREWTSKEDAKLCTAVETFGNNNWQLVASHLDGRTSNQCSVRWRNTLLPERKKVGRWSIDEDKRLKIAVILFGAKNWKKIAQFIPGRTQSQSRERWLNCLDPSLNLERWTEEEDAKFFAAIAEHGHSWSKVAACIPGRTDNQCRRRWKVLLPHEVPMLKAAQQLKKTVLISNFVGREGERPEIGPNDFTPVVSLPNLDIENNAGVGKKMSRVGSKPVSNMNASRNSKLKKARNKFRISMEEKLTDCSITNSMADACGNLSLVSTEYDSTAICCLKRKRERLLRNKQSKKSQDKSEKYGEKNSKEDCSVNIAKSAHFYLPPVLVPPSAISENACIKRTRKSTSRISQPERFISHKKERIDDIFASNELSEDALMALPLVHVMKHISRKSRAMHETSKKNLTEQGMPITSGAFPA
ncbi:myb-like protein L, partial [Phalaenopsis equestris]|uniref:myb-like protein L n=1 Tax=Phalaenopsis equestris TaxID=78828 RepID=UPI0009E3610D